MEIGRRRLNPGASPDELKALAEALGGPLPAELKAFYSQVNGMPDGNYDSRALSWWSIARIAREHASDDAEGLAFADFFIESWRFRFRLGEQGLEVLSGQVGLGEPPLVVGGFGAFVAQHLKAPQVLA